MSAFAARSRAAVIARENVESSIRLDREDRREIAHDCGLRRAIIASDGNRAYHGYSFREPKSADGCADERGRPYGRWELDPAANLDYLRQMAEDTDAPHPKALEVRSPEEYDAAFERHLLQKVGRLYFGISGAKKTPTGAGKN